MLNSEKIKSMRIAGKILSNTFDHISEKVCEGVTAFAIDQEIKAFIESNGAVPGF